MTFERDRTSRALAEGLAQRVTELSDDAYWYLSPDDYAIQIRIPQSDTEAIVNANEMLSMAMHSGTIENWTAVDRAFETRNNQRPDDGSYPVEEIYLVSAAPYTPAGIRSLELAMDEMVQGSDGAVSYVMLDRNSTVCTLRVRSDTQEQRMRHEQYLRDMCETSRIGSYELESTSVATTQERVGHVQTTVYGLSRAHTDPNGSILEEYLTALQSDNVGVTVTHENDGEESIVRVNHSEGPSVGEMEALLDQAVLSHCLGRWRVSGTYLESSKNASASVSQGRTNPPARKRRRIATPNE